MCSNFLAKNILPHTSYLTCSFFGDSYIIDPISDTL